MARIRKLIGNVKGPAGDDATINGVNAMTIAGGANVTLSQNGGALTISANVPTKVSELTNDSGFLTAHQDISGKLDASRVGTANGVAELDANGKVPSAQLPSYVDDVLERASVSAFPATGESGKIYVATDTNLTYRWSGSAYVEISPSVAIGETSATAYRGDRGKIAYEHSQTQSGNPHKVSKSDIGLGAVDNTSDADKPISNAAQAALNKKQDKEAQSEIDAAQNSRISDNESDIAAQNQEIAALKSENALLRELIQGVDAPICRTASGNPATFSDGYDNVALRNLTVTITPTQDGTPSVETPVPIPGYDNMINGSIAFTADEPFGAWFWLYVRPGKSVNQNLYIQIERGTQASPYEMYRGQSVSVPLSSRTVYGGTLDVISGTLIVTHGNIASYDGETVPDSWISSTGQLSNGAQVVYPLDTPLSYNLTPVSLTSLLGYNCVFSDAGTLAVTYRADTQITLGG